MRALVFDGELHVKEIPMPSRVRGEALIRVMTAGVCNTDVEIVKGYMGFEGVPGHEFVGIVEKCDNAHLRGKRVVGEINCSCNQCHYCQLEMPHHCLNRSVLGIQGRNGAFAEYLVLPEDNLHIVPGTIRDDVAVFAEPVAAAFRILEQISIGEDDQVVVLGDGKLGQLICQVLLGHTKHLTCVGKHKWKLDLLRDQHVDTVLFGEEQAPEGADVVVDATGSPMGLVSALELVRPEGTVVLKTTTSASVKANSNYIVINEVRIMGSRCGPFRPALEALTLGTVEVRPMITEAFELGEGVRALQSASDPGVMKVLLHI